MSLFSTGCRNLLMLKNTGQPSIRLLGSRYSTLTVRKSCRRHQLVLSRSGRATYLALLSRSFSSKQESYFSAIGGTKDEPPPDLTFEQVTKILRANEKTFDNISNRIEQVECNQLGANYPCEDRLRVASLRFDGHSEPQSFIFGVFDGHGGGLCADIVSRRLYHYLMLALSSNPKDLIEHNQIDQLVQDIVICPDPRINFYSDHYDDQSYERLLKLVHDLERQHLIQYAEKLQTHEFQSFEAKIKHAFNQCDSDLADEIEYILSKNLPRTVQHYYYSLSVSGCCANVLLLHDNKAYVANTGDCRAVLGVREIADAKPVIKSQNLSVDHNSDNLNELKRLFAAHPQKEHNNIVRNNRLLGQLMPLRAFGDFGYKWPAEKIKRLGMVRAFGPHVIPPYYSTPPYLICEPEIEVLDLETLKEAECAYVVMATDGLWEQFEGPRDVIDQVFEQEQCPKKYPSLPGEDSVKVEQVSATAGCDAALDRNGGTHLVRYALGQNPSFVDPHLSAEEAQRQEHKRMVTFLTLPFSVVRNFRDDITLILIRLSTNANSKP